MIRVLCIDDHQLVTEALERLIEDDPELEVVGVASSALAGIASIPHVRPDVVIMDYTLPDLDGVAATERLVELHPGVLVVMLTGTDSPDVRDAALRAGCAAWISKTRASVELIDTIRAVTGHGSAVARSIRVPPLDELVVHYQPVVRLADERVVGFEALVRWNGPGGDLRLPAEFLPAAEALGWVLEIDLFVARQVVADLARWQRANPGSEALWAAVNVSAYDLAEGSFASEIDRILARSAVAPGTFAVEVTETTLLADDTTIATSIATLRRDGIRLALDDFGTAYSSLANLRRVPFDVVKMDTSFTAELTRSARTVSLMRSVEQLAHDLGAIAIAEGIEEGAQADALLDAGWSYGQGFYYGRPVPFAQASEIAASRTTR